jgi:hypothetical protein
MGILARLMHAEGLLRSDVPPLPLRPFTVTGDETTLRAEVSAAIAELNEAARAFSSSKNFCREYLELIRQVEGYGAEQRWEEAHRTVWAAAFFVNRALETRGAARLQRRLTVAALLWLLLLLGAGAALKAVEAQHWGQGVLGLAYWRYPLMGTLGGVTIVVWGLIKHTVDLDFDPDYARWYYFKPILGGIMGLVAVLVILAGFVAVQGTLTVSSPLPLYIVAFLAGFSERFFIRIIDRVTTALFGGEQTAAPPRPATTPAVLSTPPADGGGSPEKHK